MFQCTEKVAVIVVGNTKTCRIVCMLEADMSQLWEKKVKKSLLVYSGS